MRGAQCTLVDSCAARTNDPGNFGFIAISSTHRPPPLFSADTYRVIPLNAAAQSLYCSRALLSRTVYARVHTGRYTRANKPSGLR